MSVVGVEDTGLYEVGVGRKGVISGSGDGGSNFALSVSKEKIVGSGGVSSASVFSGSAPREVPALLLALLLVPLLVLLVSASLSLQLCLPARHASLF